MPKISEFFGISIYMYYREHQPPHFHAIYGGEEAQILIENLSVLSGRLSPKALGLVIEWAVQHKDQLHKIWEQAKTHHSLDKIEPLK